jgi:1-acyl-sn-glycerol-3-phosphate acyltransferase
LTIESLSLKLVDSMSFGSTILAASAGWILLVLACRLGIRAWVRTAAGDDAITGVLWRLLRIYARVVHRVTYDGMEEFRLRKHVGPLIVVSNHTGAVDPLLIQAGCHFHIRWMMASEMMSPGLDWLWKHQKLIPVDRDGKDSGPAREAIRHVQGGGTIGIFPEGRIVDPPRQIRPFFPGVGLIVARAKAPVLLCSISGTPDTNSMKQSLFTRSRAHVRFLEIIPFRPHVHMHEFTDELREKLACYTGWPLNNQPQPPPSRRGMAAMT